MTTDNVSRSGDKDQPVQSRISAGVAVITLNSPANRNAVSPSLLTGLMSALDHAEQNSACRAVLLTGVGPAFCSGQDLTQRDPRKVPFPPDLSKTIELSYNPLIRRLRDFGLPTVCAVNGVAAGAGIGIALACDITIASAEADFVLAFSRIGLIPDAGATWMLTRRLGEARALALALTGARISGAEAAEMGLIWKAVAPDDLLGEARALSERLATGPAEALRLTRQAIHSASDHAFDAQLDLERDLQGRAGRNPDYAEGVLAFLEKRRAQFGPEREDDEGDGQDG